MTVFEEPGGNEPPGLLLRLIRDQRVAFLIVGGINTVVGFGLFILFDFTVGRAVDSAAGTVLGSLATLGCSHVLGVIFAFVMHRRFVFRVTGHLWRDLARFESVYLVALAFNAVTLPVLVEVGLNRIVAQAIITLISTVLSYVGHRYFSFRRSPKDTGSA
jgi:putative flippase GtrA